MASDRYLDLIKQGFMKPRKAEAPEESPVTVACDDCQNWHAKGKHTSPADVRAARRSARGTPNKQRVL